MRLPACANGSRPASPRWALRLPKASPHDYDPKQIIADPAGELLRQQLSAIETALQASEAKGQQQRVEIEDLGRRLNLALATQVQELQRYRSEFFGRLR